MLKVEQRKPNDRNRGEYDVVALVYDLVVHYLAREHGVETKPEVRKDEKGILIEAVANKVRIPSVSFPSMVKQ